jgi:chromosome segregation ATPase
MVNQHVIEAARNLQRAAEDMHQRQNLLRNEIENRKRDTAKTIDELQSRIAYMQRMRANDPNSTLDDHLVNAETAHLTAKIADLQRDADTVINNLQQQIDELQRRMNDLNSMSNQVEAMASLA